VIAFVVAEAIYFVLAGLVFVILYATRSAWRTTTTGQNVMAFTAGFVALVAALLINMAQRVPVWVFALIVGELCYAMTQRVWLLWRAQREEASNDQSSGR